MPRTLIAAANWKMHKTSADATALVSDICAGAPPRTNYEIVFCPPFTAIPSAVEAARGQVGVTVGGQNCFWENEGAFTGEVFAPMLADLGCRCVIIGHSERRQYFGETDAMVAKRVRAALGANLACIVCIGETIEEREANETESVLSRQLEGGLGDLVAADWAHIVIAYEPVWAIGTGRTATPEMANDAHTFIRAWIAGHVNTDAASTTRILYGGSMKPDNAGALCAMPDIDGGLIGGASLKADQFLGIITALTGTSQPTAS